MCLCRWWAQNERLYLLLYPGRGPNNPSRPASSSCCFLPSVSENQPCSVRNEGCYATRRSPLWPLCLLLRPVLPGCSLLFARKGPDETLVWRKCRPEQLQIGTHLSSGSPECQTVLRAGACSCLAYVACMPKNAPYAVCRVPAVACTDVEMPGLLAGFLGIWKNWR